MVFEAFDGTGSLIGSVGPDTIALPGFDGLTNEDRFYGVIDSGGIGSIRVSQTFGSFGIEVDHLQYGVAGDAISEPGAVAILGFGIAGLIGLRRRRRRNG